MSTKIKLSEYILRYLNYILICYFLTSISGQNLRCSECWGHISFEVLCVQKVFFVFVFWNDVKRLCTPLYSTKASTDFNKTFFITQKLRVAVIREKKKTNRKFRITRNRFLAIFIKFRSSIASKDSSTTH